MSIQNSTMFFKPCGVKLLTKDVNYDLLSLSFNKRCFFQVNFLMNASFENAAFIRGWCLFHISLPKYGVYKGAVFKRGNSVKYFTSVRSVGIILWWWWFGGGGSHEMFTNREGGPTIFLLLPGGDQKFNRVFHPVSTTPPPPRELKNDNSLMQLEQFFWKISSIF